MDIDRKGKLDKAWVTFRRSNHWYYINKAFSINFSLILACVSLKMKVEAKILTGDNALEYNFLLWFIFMYYAFQMLDESVELFATT